MSRPVLYPLRTVDSATVGYTAAPHRRRRVTIDHRPLPGVTPSMLLDWFCGLGGTMEYGGEMIDRYLAWHPVDHIRWELASAGRGERSDGERGTGAAEGARFRIVEAFGGRPEYRVDVVDRVEKLDETGIRLVQRVAGVIVFSLEHTWSAGSDGTHYVSVLDIGARTPVFRPVNAYLYRRFPDHMVRAWVRHNIEEVGQLEFLLPGLSTRSPAGGRARRAAADPAG